jgi:hypothetical protein
MVMSVPNRLLVFEGNGELVANRLQVYGRVTTLTGGVAFEFDDEIVVSYTALNGRLSDAVLEGKTLYRRALSLRPGTYKLDTLVREVSSGKMGTAARGITVPNLAKGQNLQLSPVVLASELETPRPGNPASEDYLLGQFRIRPNVEGVFHRDDYLAWYFEVYDFSTDSSANAGSLSVEYAIIQKGSTQLPVFRDITREILVDGDRVRVPRQVSLGAYGSGSYEVRFRVTDKVSGQVVTQSTPFRIQ